MEQSVEIRVRRVTGTLYDLVILRDGDVEVRHVVPCSYVQDCVRDMVVSRISLLKVGGSVNFKSNIKFM